MHNKLSWTLRESDGVKREVRVEVTSGRIKWQFKRADEDRWDYDSLPRVDDWDALDEVLERRAGRGRGDRMRDVVRKFRVKAGV